MPARRTPANRHGTRHPARRAQSARGCRTPAIPEGRQSGRDIGGDRRHDAHDRTSVLVVKGSTGVGRGATARSQSRPRDPLHTRAMHKNQSSPPISLPRRGLSGGCGSVAITVPVRRVLPRSHGTTPKTDVAAPALRAPPAPDTRANGWAEGQGPATWRPGAMPHLEPLDAARICVRRVRKTRGGATAGRPSSPDRQELGLVCLARMRHMPRTRPE
jgi:hypothetical protein